VNGNNMSINSGKKMKPQPTLTSQPGPPGERDRLASEIGFGAEPACPQKNFLAA